MFLSDLSTKRPVMITMILSVFILFGIISYLNLPLNLMPEMKIPFVTVQTVYPGSGPKQIETLITDKIEDEVSSISLIDNITSYSMDGVSIIIIRFELGKDPDIANQEVKDKVALIANDLPEDAWEPTIEKLDLNAQPIIDIVLSGDLSVKELYDIADNELKDKFSRLKGVGKVKIVGGQERQIRVEFDPKIVNQQALSLPYIDQVIAGQNMELPAGNFTQDAEEYSVRLKGDFSDLEELKNTEIPTAQGNMPLWQLAEINDTGEVITEKAIFLDNITKKPYNNAVILSLVASPDGNAVKVAKEVYELIPEIQKGLPSNVELNITMDKSLFIKGSVNDTLSNIIMGIILTSLVLLLFLHDLRSTAIVAITMPASIIPTFLGMNMLGFSLNIMSLMGLSSAVGTLVMNSVVVLENIFKHKEMKEDKLTSARKGTSEVAVAVIASALTNIAVFLPIGLLEGIVGLIFREFAVTIVIATVFSLFIAFTLTPMMAAIILPEHDKKKHPIGMRIENFFHGVEKKYHKLLKKILNSKKNCVTVIIATIAIFIVTMAASGLVGFEFMPAMDEGDIQLELELPEGYNLYETEKKIKDIEKIVKENELVKYIVSSAGRISDSNVGVNLALMKIKLIERAKRNKSNVEVASDITQELSNITNATIRIAGVSPGAGGSSEAPVDFYILGDDMGKIASYEAKILEDIKQIPGLINITSSLKKGKPELSFTPYRKKMSDAGLKISDLAYTLRASVEGLSSSTYKEKGNEYDIKVMMGKEYIDDPKKVANIPINTAKGVFPISQFAKVEYTSGYNKIIHRDKAKAIEISGYLNSGYVLGDIVAEIEKKIEKNSPPAGCTIIWAGDSETMKETGSDMLMAFITAIILTYMLLAAILENYTQPLLILGTVPLALIGVILAFIITAKTMNLISMLAIVMLVGLVVNNAILLLDQMNQYVASGKSKHDALLLAAPQKLKPIAMSGIAVILGMLPMALGLGASAAEMRQPMGIVSIGGLAASTLLTLFVIPSIEMLSEHRKEKKK